MISQPASRFGAALLALASLAPSTASAQGQRRSTPNDTLKSTEVADDHKVTFRIYAPKASEVSVSGDFGQGGKMEKDDQGVWSSTVGPLTPDFYSYTFNVDGVRTVDPKNADDQAGPQQPRQPVPRAGRGGRVRDDEGRAARRRPRRLVSLRHARHAAPDARLHAPGIRGRHGEDIRSSTCSTGAATRTRAGARSAAPGSSSTT